MSLAVLVVDDDPDVLAVVTAYLESDERAPEVHYASDADGAVRLAVEQHPDVVIVDYRMPGVDGMALLPYLRWLLPDARLVVYSADASQELADRAADVGGAVWVSKGQPLDALLAASLG